MSLLVKELSDTEFLITKSVCSPKDQFTRAKARKNLNARMLAHESCVANSKNYSTTTKNYSNVVYSKEGYPWEIKFSVTIYRHSKTYSDMAYRINILSITSNPAHPASTKPDMFSVISSVFQVDFYI